MTGKSFFLLAGFLIFGVATSHAIETGTEKPPQTAQLDPGDYTWQPSLAPSGPVVIVVDLSKQLLQVYRNGVEIGRSTVSSGVQDHPTQSGIFTILQKNITHHSNQYHEATMPYMERLTWGGLAIHAGNVPDHPESHGCVHVPMAFAKKLYGITQPGTTVLIANGTAPTDGKQPSLVFAKNGSAAPPPPAPGQPFRWHPQTAPSGPVCVVLSSADRQIHVYRNGKEIGDAWVGAGASIPSLGDRVYAAQAQTDPNGFHAWNLLGSVDASPAPAAKDVLGQLNLPPDFLNDLHSTVTPGATLVLTDQPLDQQKAPPSGQDILDTASS
jgi:hypothetical protein